MDISVQITRPFELERHNILPVKMLWRSAFRSWNAERSWHYGARFGPSTE